MRSRSGSPFVVRRPLTMSSYSSASVTTMTAQFTTASAKLLAAEPHCILDLIEAQCDASVGDLRCEGKVLEHVEPVMGRLQLIEFKFFELLALKKHAQFRAA
jgi:hypothetical protein